MLPRNLRLPSSEFRKIKKYGQISPEKDFVVSYRKNNFSTGPRFGFVIGKVIARKATKRNLIKRYLSEAVYAFVAKNKVALKGVGFDVCFVARKAILTRKYEEINSGVDKALSAVFKL